MKQTVKIINLFKTSIGEVAVLAFWGEGIPCIGMILKDKSNAKWKISSIGGNKKLEQQNDYKEYNADSVWDCTVKPLNHSQVLKIDDTLEVEGKGNVSK